MNVNLRTELYYIRISNSTVLYSTLQKKEFYSVIHIDTAS